MAHVSKQRNIPWNVGIDLKNGKNHMLQSVCGAENVSVAGLLMNWPKDTQRHQD